MKFVVFLILVRNALKMNALYIESASALSIYLQLRADNYPPIELVDIVEECVTSVGSKSERMREILDDVGFTPYCLIESSKKAK